MRTIILILCVGLAIFVVAPFALGAGYALNNGNMDVRLLSHTNETSVTGSNNHIVNVAGNRNEVTATSTETTPRPSLVGSAAGNCLGVVMFLLIVGVFVGGMVVYGRSVA